MADNFVERRRYPRSDAFLVMEVEDAKRPLHKRNVITNNVSAGGVYFKTPHGEEFRLGMDVALTIFLSTPISKGGSHTSTVRGGGRIVREEKFQGDVNDDEPRRWKGIAIEFDEPLRIL